MKIEDLSEEKLKNYAESKGLSLEGTKKELCEAIEQQVTNEIQKCWDEKNKPIEEQQEKEEHAMLVNDEIGKDLQHYFKLQEQQKIKLLEKYEDLQNQKQKLKDRIKEQQQAFLKLPNILRFNVGQEVSISKSLLENHPNSLLYTLISSPIWFEQYKENQNKYYLNCSEEEISKIFDFVRIGNTSDLGLCKEWGFLPREHSNQICLELDNQVSKQNEESKTDIEYFKDIFDEEIEDQFDLLKDNFDDHENQIEQLKEMVYNDPMILNVGGKIFSISKSRLENHENTYFAPLVSGQWKLENNTHFIDRSCQHFHMVYYCLVHNEVPPNLDQYFKSLNEEDQNIFIQELDYYQLDQILHHLQYDFSQSKVLNEEEVEYVQTLYPGKWRLIPTEELTDKIHQTTVLIADISRSGNQESSGTYSKITLDFIDLQKPVTIRFDFLEMDKRGTTKKFRYSFGIMEPLKNKKYEIYEKII